MRGGNRGGRGGRVYDMNDRRQEIDSDTSSDEDFTQEEVDFMQRIVDENGPKLKGIVNVSTNELMANIF